MDVSQPMRMSQTELDVLFGNSPAGDILREGQMRGCPLRRERP